MTTRAVLARLLTPRGQGGISVVAVQGPGATDLLDRLFRSPRARRLSDAPPGALLYGALVRHGEMLDEVVVCRRGAEAFELNCHGGVAPLKRVLDAVEAEGAAVEASGPTPADPAFAAAVAAGDSDAIRREAAAALPHAATPLAAMMLLDQLHGALSDALADAADHSPDDADARRHALPALLQTAPLGLGLCRPPRLVVAGPPNVGKSTLVNRLLAEERMIVHDRPGTTRDVVAQLVAVRGYPMELADTAGIGPAQDGIDALAIARSRREVVQAAERDVLLLTLDASRPDQTDLLADLPAHPRTLIVLNKIDLRPGIDTGAWADRLGAAPLPLSALTGEGFDRLEEALLDAAFPIRWQPRMAVIFTERQRDLIARAVGRPADASRHIEACLRAGPPPAGEAD